MRPAFALAVAATLAASAAPAAEPLHRLHSDGYGPARVGMTPAQARRALGVKLVASDSSTPADPCFHLRAARGHEGVAFMFQDGRLTRASLYGDAESRVRTVSGVGLGDPAAKVWSAYGAQLADQSPPAAGQDEWGALIWVRKNRGVRIETTYGKVTGIHAGDESIQLEEGCS